METILSVGVERGEDSFERPLLFCLQTVHSDVLYLLWGVLNHIFTFGGLWTICNDLDDNMPTQVRELVPKQHLNGGNGVGEQKTVHWKASIRQRIYLSMGANNGLYV